MFKVNQSTGIITMTRGDTFTTQIYIDMGTAVNPLLVDLEEGDKVYFALMEANQKWEDALIKKVYDKQHGWDPEQHCINLSFDTEDTEFLLPGNYYYQVKLRKNPEIKEEVDTIISRTKFVILE